jgi:hypothetical protein
MVAFTRRWARSAAFAALLLPAGCADVVMTTRYAPGYSGNVVKSFLAYAGSEGPVLVRVLNNPFGGPALGGMVAAEAGQAAPIRVTFTANPAETGRPDWPIVVIFNPPSGTNVRDACENPEAIKPIVPSAGSEMLASFCNDRKLIAGIRAVTEKVTSAADPRLKALTHRAIQDLFGPGDTDDGDGRTVFPD